MNADRALRRYYRTLRGPSKSAPWKSYVWVLAGPAAVVAMLVAVASLPSPSVNPAGMLLRHQAEMLGYGPAGRGGGERAHRDRGRLVRLKTVGAQPAAGRLTV